MSANPVKPGVGLPPDLWVGILSFLPHADLGRALCTSRAICDVSQQAWRAACYRRWPRWAAIAAEPGAKWRRVYELLSLREDEASALVDVPAIRRTQTLVNEGHRAILTEWLCEVSFEWDLESAVVYKAVEYLDHYLTHNAVPKLGRLQLVGLACLRVAMMEDGVSPAIAGAGDAMLEPQRFAYISDSAYTIQEVEDFTKELAAGVPARMRDSPNAKMYLRSFWYRATQQGVVGADDMHVYTAASFLLQLALLDLPCAAFAPSRLAAAALSLSLGTFGKPAWPAALQRFGSYEAADLQAPRRQLAAAQASRAASQLRRIWTAQYEDHGYAECAEQWLHVRCLLACPSRLLPDVGPERGEPEAPGYAPSGIPPPPLGGGPAGTTAAVLV